jgi:hemerythrin-like domain-containing protein
MDARTMLEQQHREAERLIEQLENADAKDKRRLFLQLADALSIHAIIEERHFYPVVRERRTAEMLDESLSEHLTVKSILATMLDLPVDDPEFDRQLETLAAETRQHVRKEEEQLFPKLEAILEPEELERIAARMAETIDDLHEEGDPREHVRPVEIEPPAPTL